MTKLLRSIWFVVLVALVVSCAKDDPLPRATVDFTHEIAEVGIEVMFDNLTLNADRYEWAFSDGQTSDAISPTMTFDEPGELEVVLRAFTKDGQKDTLARTITIRQRYLTQYFVKSFPYDSIGFAWDKNAATEEDKWPDVLVELVVNKTNPTEAELENSVLEGLFVNAKGQDIANEVTYDVILTNEEWNFFLSDWDGADINNPTFADPFSLMMGATFNPVQATTTKVSESEGFFSLTGFDNNNNFIDVLFFFELR